MKYILVFCIFITDLLLLVGCQAKPEANIPPSPILTAIQTISLSETTAFTTLPSPSPTTANEASPSKTLAPIVPTYPVQEARNKLLDLLSTNGGCELPCILGIEPGSNTPRSAQETLRPLTSISMFGSFENELNNALYSVPYESITITIRLDYRIDHDDITYISFEGDAVTDLYKPPERGLVDVFDSPGFGNVLQQYMISSVLAKLGVPSAVYLSTLAKIPAIEREPYGKFQIILVYKERGIFVQYLTKMEIVDEYVVGCFSNAHARLVVFPEDDLENFESWIAAQEELLNYLPLEETTSMSINDFHRLFSEGVESCIRTKSEIWPLPEF